MEAQEKLKLVTKGFGLAMNLPEEFKNAIRTKINELSDKSSKKEYWKAISQGFELGIQEKTQNRLNELEKVKKPRGRSQGRTL